MKNTLIAVGLILVGSICILLNSFLNQSNQNRLNTEREHRAVDDIGTEISLYKFHHKYGTERMGEVIASAERLLNAMRNPEIHLSKEEIDLDLHKLTWLWLAATPTTEYVALNASGDFGLITSLSLRKKLKELNSDQEKLLQFEAIQVRYVDQQLKPFLNRHVDRTAIDTYQKADRLITSHHSSPLENASRDLLTNREFANILGDLLFCTKRIMLPYKRMAVIIKEMEGIISTEYPSVRVEPYDPF